jgi:hypothetical protein
MPSTPTRGRVFISHSHKDNELVRDLARRLRLAGLEPWVDLHDIPAGSKWKKMLHEQIRSADAMLLLVTPSALRSPWMMTELGMAEGMERIIVPVTAGLSSRDLPEPLQTFQVTPFDEVDRVIGKLANQLTSPASE